MRDGSYRTLGRGNGDSQGCATFYSNPYRIVGMYVYEQVGRAFFNGRTGPHEVRNSSVHLGTYWVDQYGSN